jgi:hypothetical protein
MIVDSRSEPSGDHAGMAFSLSVSRIGGVKRALTKTVSYFPTVRQWEIGFLKAG